MMIKVRVIPAAKRTEIVSRIGSVLRVRIETPSFEDRANKLLLSFLADFFEVPEAKVFLRKGRRAKEKVIEIEGKSEEKLRQVLESVP